MSKDDSDLDLIDARLSGLLWPVLTLGPGRRVGVWFQGCTIGCAGCLARDTWPQAGGVVLSAGELAARIVGCDPDGVTFSGGEPFEQPEALLRTVELIKNHNPTIDVLVYSGLAAADLTVLHERLLRHLDGVVAGPYVASRAGDDHWRGSTNQELLVTSPLGRIRLERWVATTSAQPLQVKSGPEGLEVVGIPTRAALGRFEHRLRTQGVALSPEWRPNHG